MCRALGLLRGCVALSSLLTAQMHVEARNGQSRPAVAPPADDPAADRLRLVVQLGHSSSVINCVAFSPDSRLVLTGASDKTACLWHAATGRELRRFTGHSREVTAGAIWRDNALVLTGSKDDTVRLWDARTGQELRRFEGHKHDPIAHGVTFVGFTPDDRFVLSGSESDYTVRLWDRASGQQVRIYYGVPQAVSSDGSTFVIDTRYSQHWPRPDPADRGVFLRDALTGDVRQRFSVRPNDPSSPRYSKYHFVALSPDSRFVLESSYSNAEGTSSTCRLWNLETGEVLHTFEGDGATFSGSALSPDGRSAVAWGARGFLDFWDTRTGQVVRRVQAYESSARFAGTKAVSPDGRAVVSAGFDYFGARLWELASGRETARLSGQSPYVYEVAVSPSGRYIALATGLSLGGAR